MDGFDFTTRMHLLCCDMVQRLPELSHIDMSRVAIGYIQARKLVPHGIQACLTPMRFADGSLVEERHGQRLTCQRLFLDGREMLYILHFYLPRFMNESFQEKVNTTLHELWHVGPNFDGDLRRHEGRYYMHSGSQKDYDEQMEQLAARWLALRPPSGLYDFLMLDFAELKRHHGNVFGRQIAHPKLLPVVEPIVDPVVDPVVESGGELAEPTPCTRDQKRRTGT